MEPARNPWWVWVLVCGCVAVAVGPFVIPSLTRPRVWTEADVRQAVQENLRVGATRAEVEAFARGRGWRIRQDEADVMGWQALAGDESSIGWTASIYLRFSFGEDGLLCLARVTPPVSIAVSTHPAGSVVLGNPASER